MDDDEISEATVAELGHSGALPSPLSRLASVVVSFGLIVAVAGGWSLPGAEGAMAPLAWALLVLGLALALVTLVIVALAWLGNRPAQVSSSGFTLPGWWRAREVAWSDVHRCRIRRTADGKRRLLAVLLESDPDGTPLWLGDVTRSSIPEKQLMALVDHWTGGRADTDKS